MLVATSTDAELWANDDFASPTIAPSYEKSVRKGVRLGQACGRNLLLAHVAKAHRHNCPRWRVLNWKNNARQPILYRTSFGLIPAELLVFYDCIVRDQSICKREAVEGEECCEPRLQYCLIPPNHPTSTHHTHTLDSLTLATPAPSSSPHFHPHARCAFAAPRYCTLAFVQEYDFVEALTRTSRLSQTPTHEPFASILPLIPKLATTAIHYW